MKKTLTICEKPIITSECFTYYKMAIIQTIPNYEAWLINRFKLFIDEDGDTFIISRDHDQRQMSHSF